MKNTSRSALTTPLVDDGFHVISYAYPSSPLATSLDCHDGCFAVQTAISMKPYRTFAEALREVEFRETLPGRWSIDHPLNVTFLSWELQRDIDAAKDSELWVKTRPGDFGSAVWKIARIVTGRRSKLNDDGRKSLALRVITVSDPFVKERLRDQMVDKRSFMVRMNGAYGTVIEIVFQSLECDARDHEVSCLAPYEEVAQAILRRLQDLASDFPKVKFAVPPRTEVVDGRPAAWAFVPDGALSPEMRLSLAKLMSEV